MNKDLYKLNPNVENTCYHFKQTLTESLCKFLCLWLGYHLAILRVSLVQPTSCCNDSPLSSLISLAALHGRLGTAREA